VDIKDNCIKSWAWHPRFQITKVASIDIKAIFPSISESYLKRSNYLIQGKVKFK